MGGFDYKQYIAPGLIMMSVITNSYGNVVASFFGAKFGKHVEELLVSPLPNWVIVAGYATGGVVRGVLVGVAVTVVSLVFTHLHVHHLGLIVSALVLTSLTFALGGFLNALFAKNFDQVNWIPSFVLTPLTYFGGVFYSVSLLPDWARTLSYVNPDPLHGQRLPLRLPRRLRRRRRRGVRADGGRGGGAVRRRGRPHEPRDGNAGVSPAVALVSARAARGLDEDMPPLLAAFAAAGATAEIADWDDPQVEWQRFDLALLRSAWDYTERLPRVPRLGGAHAPRARSC